jgi:anhydrotetracycline 6-monooxygenase / 5a,11a-dehydrotetracycline 5-monooxygenase
VDVIIVGAGPVGLMLAAELRLHDVEVVVLERLAAPTGFSKAFGLHARSIETMELRGLVDRFNEYGQRAARELFGAGAERVMPRGRVPLAHFAGIRTIRLDRLGTAHGTLLPLPQARMEAALAELAVERGAEIRRGREVTGLYQDADGVAVEVAGHGRLRAAYVVGCDGGRSTVRRLAGFDFPGTDGTITCRLGDVAVPELFDEFGGWHRTAGGVIQVTPMRVLTVEFDGPPADRDAPMTVDELAASVRRVAGRAVAIPEEPRWMSRFTDNTRQVGEYRRGRVLLAGDAAHVHSPFGGQGLNLGVQDAVNLGWKLAGALAGWAPDGLLDTYTAERHPVAARVLHNTRAQVALMNPDPRITPLREYFAELMELPAVNRYLGEMITALEVRYAGGDHPLVGRFLPDLAIRTAGGDTRARALCRAGRPVLLDLADDAGVRKAAEPWADRVDIIAATSDDPAAAALLVRPDGYLAWASDGGADGLAGSLAGWFGPAR